ncbi:MAG: response regulator transcription factor [Chloroflexota bacterium]
MISLVIADDQPAVREGLRMRLSIEADMQIVGEAQNGVEALEVTTHLHPNIVLMDLEMPHMDGLAATRALQSLAPECCVILLTIHDDETTRKRAREVGAAGFVSKHADDSVLLDAIRALAGRLENKD